GTTGAASAVGKSGATTDLSASAAAAAATGCAVTGPGAAANPTNTHSISGHMGRSLSARRGRGIGYAGVIGSSQVAGSIDCVGKPPPLPDPHLDPGHRPPLGLPAQHLGRDRREYRPGQDL